MTTTPARPTYTVSQVTSHIWGLIGDYMKADRTRSDDFLHLGNELQAALSELAEAAQDPRRTTAPQITTAAVENGAWHWILKSDIDNKKTWIPAQRERSHWNSAKFSGIPTYEVEVGPVISVAAATSARPFPAIAESGNPLGKSNSSFDTSNAAAGDATPEEVIELAEELVWVTVEDAINNTAAAASLLEEGEVRTGMELACEEIKTRLGFDAATLPSAISVTPVAAEPDKSKDAERLDWLDAAAENGCVTFGLEMDGGVFLKLEGIGEEPEDYRNTNDVRHAIDAALQAAATKEGVQP